MGRSSGLGRHSGKEPISVMKRLYKISGCDEFIKWHYLFDVMQQAIGSSYRGISVSEPTVDSKECSQVV